MQLRNANLARNYHITWCQSACFKGFQTSCTEIISGVFLPKFGRKISHHVMDVCCWWNPMANPTPERQNNLLSWAADCGGHTKSSSLLRVDLDFPNTRIFLKICFLIGPRNSQTDMGMKLWTTKVRELSCPCQVIWCLKLPKNEQQTEENFQKTQYIATFSSDVCGRLETTSCIVMFWSHNRGRCAACMSVPRSVSGSLVQVIRDR